MILVPVFSPFAQQLLRTDYVYTIVKSHMQDCDYSSVGRVSLLSGPEHHIYRNTTYFRLLAEVVFINCGTEHTDLVIHFFVNINTKRTKIRLNQSAPPALCTKRIHESIRQHALPTYCVATFIKRPRFT